MFAKHKITLELGEDRENCLEKIEFQFDSQINLDDLINQVFRPLLIGLGYCNETITNSFHMNEFGEDVETPDFEDGALDIEKDLPPIESEFLPKTQEELKDCSDLSTNDL
jgi:hypothetical protein